MQFTQEAIGGSKDPRRFCELEAASENGERVYALVETAKCYPLEPRLTQGWVSRERRDEDTQVSAVFGLSFIMQRDQVMITGSNGGGNLW